MESATCTTETTETTETSFRLSVRSWRRWPSVVARIQAGDPAGSVELYEALRTGFYGHIWRQLGAQDAEDHVQSVWIIVSQAIIHGEVREPERVMGFVGTITKRLIAQQIEKRVNSQRRTVDAPHLEFFRDNQPDPEATFAAREQIEISQRVLAGMKSWEREILERCYFLEQPAAEVQSAMHLTGTQFRVDKCRAKARFTQLGRALLTARRAA